MNIKILKSAEELDKIPDYKPKYFRVDILDNDVPIYTQKGYNQITLSHFMFRCNQGLPDTAEEGKENEEVKHNYVIQALFDLNEWPEGKSQCEQSDEFTWLIKMYSSETLALIKDTDKEDKEKSLKGQWEADEVGRAEKAKISRQKYLLKIKQKNGETLTEEELEIVNEKRERIRKKDQDEQAVKGGGKGGKAPPPKGGKGAPAKGAPATEEEDNTV